MANWTDNLAALALRLMSALEWLAGAMLVRLAARASARSKELEQVNETQKEQLEIAARPPSAWARLLERMRRGDL